MAIFVELDGFLKQGPIGPLGPEGRLVLSTLMAGESEVNSPPAIGLAYVASGVEIYRFGGRTYPVPAGNFLVVPKGHNGQAEIGRSPDGAALGLCVSLPSNPDVQGMALDAPMVFPATCSALGRTLAHTHRHVRRRRSDGATAARALLGGLGAETEALLEEATRILGGLSAMRAATRHETLRRLNIARGYLHDVTDHAVNLEELARIAGISRFQLLRSFRDAFGEPPAAYHRRIRLELAKTDIDQGRLSCGDAAQRYGFADSSSFSHAYKRTFGVSPRRVPYVSKEVLQE